MTLGAKRQSRRHYFASSGSAMPFESLKVRNIVEGLTILRQVEGELAPTGAVEVRGIWGAKAGIR